MTNHTFGPSRSPRSYVPTVAVHLFATLLVVLGSASRAGAQLTDASPWTPATPYPGVVAQQSCVTSGGYVYCVGGRVVSDGWWIFDTQAFDRTFYAPLTPAGPGRWVETTPYGKGASPDDRDETVDIRSLSCGAHEGYIYCVAGTAGKPGDSASTTDVMFAPLSASGIGSWSRTSAYELPPPTSRLGIMHDAMFGSDSSVTGTQCVVEQGHLVCVGGIESVSVPSTDHAVPVPTDVVMWAPLSPQGVGPWRTAPTYGAGGVANHACVAHEGYVYCVAGRLNRSWTDYLDPRRTNEVWFAPFSPAEGVGVWRRTLDYPAFVERHVCAVVSGNVVCVGGAEDAVWSAPLSGDGVGPWVAHASYPALPYWEAGSCVNYDRRLLCIGGHNATTAFFDVDTIDAVFVKAFTVRHHVSDQASCRAALGARWVDHDRACVVESTRTIDVDTTVSVARGTTLRIAPGGQLHVSGTLICDGICETAGGGFVNTSGRLDVAGELRVLDGTFTNASGGRMDVTGVVLTRAGTTNAGLLILNGTWTNEGVVHNTGTIGTNGPGRLLNAERGTIDNRGLITIGENHLINAGRITTVLSAVTCQRASTLSPSSPVIVPGTWTSGTCRAGLETGGFSVPAGFTLHVPAGTTLLNQGRLTVTGTLTNEGTVRNETATARTRRSGPAAVVSVVGTWQNARGSRLVNGPESITTIFGRFSNGGEIAVLQSSGLGIGVDGVLDNTGRISIGPFARFNIYGVLRNAGVVTNAGQITTLASGQVANVETGTVVNTSGGTTNGLTGTLSSTIGARVLTLDDVTCAALGGTWSAQSPRCTIDRGAPTLAAGTRLVVDARTTLSLRTTLHINGALQIDGSLINQGLLAVQEGFLRISHGAVSLNFGTIRTEQPQSMVDTTGSLTNAAYGTIQHSGGSWTNGGLFDNFGRFRYDTTVHNDGTWTNLCAGTTSGALSATVSGNAPLQGGCDRQSPLAPVSIQLSPSPTSSSPGQAVTLTATLSSTTATGTVTFYDGTTALGRSAVTSGTAALVTTALTPGVRALTARYSGDGAHASAQSAVVSHSVAAAGSRPAGVATGDWNGDGHLDLAVVNEGSDTVTVMFGDGRGQFRTGPSYAVQSNPIGIAVADVNRDGLLDLLVANYWSHSVSTLLGGGRGTFRPAIHSDAGPGAVAIAVLDADGDGIVDLAVANNLGNELTVLRGRGTGAFDLWGAVPVGEAPRAVAAADLNGDGLIDLVAANDVSRSVTVALGQGGGTFAVMTTITSQGRPAAVGVADMNGDRVPDLVVANSGSTTADRAVEVWLGRGDGTFTTGRFLAAAQPRAIAMADFNLDGVPDVATANHGDQTVILHLASQTTVVPVGQGPRAMAVGDFNGDGRPDVVTADTLSDSITVWLNTIDRR